MRGKKSYPYPSYKNPIILPRSFASDSAYSVKDQLIEIQKMIMANEKDFQRKGSDLSRAFPKGDKISSLPFWFDRLQSVVYHS